MPQIIENYVSVWVQYDLYYYPSRVAIFNIFIPCLKCVCCIKIFYVPRTAKTFTIPNIPDFLRLCDDNDDVGDNVFLIPKPLTN